MGRWRSRVGGVVVVSVLSVGALAAAAQEQIGTFESLSVAASAVGITSTITNPSGRPQMNVCSVQAEQTVRWRADGTNPTATVGTVLTPTMDPIALPNNAVARRFRVIGTGPSTNAAVNVTCYP